ncbi:MAG: UvrD-helicase domain-containing protein, partial [Bacilli bacterium]|nr:UvrD-helicase domain-containing protein [Bacilli bacterium]
MDKEEIKYCYGCGLPLQSSNPNGKGFLPQEVLENSKENKLCQRCFKIQNYNLDTCDEKFNLDEFKKIISHAHEKKSLIVYIIDLFSLETSFLNEIIDESTAPFIYEKIGTTLRHIMIDEFQDTSRQQ